MRRANGEKQLRVQCSMKLSFFDFLSCQTNKPVNNEEVHLLPFFPSWPIRRRSAQLEKTNQPLVKTFSSPSLAVIIQIVSDRLRGSAASAVFLFHPLEHCCSVMVVQCNAWSALLKVKDNERVFNLLTPK